MPQFIHSHLLHFFYFQHTCVSQSFSTPTTQQIKRTIHKLVFNSKFFANSFSHLRPHSPLISISARLKCSVSLGRQKIRNLRFAHFSLKKSKPHWAGMIGMRGLKLANPHCTKTHTLFATHQFPSLKSNKLYRLRVARKPLGKNMRKNCSWQSSLYEDKGCRAWLITVQTQKARTVYSLVKVFSLSKIRKL